MIGLGYKGKLMKMQKQGINRTLYSCLKCSLMFYCVGTVLYNLVLQCYSCGLARRRQYEKSRREAMRTQQGGAVREGQESGRRLTKLSLSINPHLHNLVFDDPECMLSGTYCA